MVQKQPIRRRMKIVIEALRGGKKTWSDLANLGIPEKTLSRILKDYLQEWGLVRKEGDFWVWYEHSRVVGSRDEYDIAIQHSRRLMPAFSNMLEVSTTRHPLYGAAAEHLRSGYPDIYVKLQKLEQLYNERVRELLGKYGDKIKTSGFVLMHFEKGKRDGLLGNILQRDALIRDEAPYMIDLGSHRPTEVELKELNELRDWLEVDKRVFSERFEVFHELAGDISTLVLRTEMGQPLEGACGLCPRVTFVGKEMDRLPWSRYSP